MMKYYTESHEWLQIKGTVGTVGITDYAQNELGEIVYIELPKVGDKVMAGQEVCVLESTKAAADVYAPISGKIVAVNDRLKANPSDINKTAETTGWFFQIEPSNLKELDHLLNEKHYLALIST